MPKLAPSFFIQKTRTFPAPAFTIPYTHKEFHTHVSPFTIVQFPLLISVSGEGRDEGSVNASLDNSEFSVFLSYLSLYQ